MAKTTGDKNSQAAVFVYKDDGTQNDAFQEIKNVQKHGPIRGEVHSVKEEFLSGLRVWNAEIDPGDAFLCLYAHMGKPGICCTSNDASRLVSWLELAAALPRTVDVLWLAGCTSNHAISAWSGPENPVRRYLAATSDSKFFLPLVSLFKAEISIDPLFYFDEMPVVLRTREPDIAAVTDYHEVVGNTFTLAFQSVTITERISMKIDRLFNQHGSSTV